MGVEGRVISTAAIPGHPAVGNHSIMQDPASSNIAAVFAHLSFMCGVPLLVRVNDVYCVGSSSSRTKFSTDSNAVEASDLHCHDN
jgi:hypothetical protein